MLASGSMDTRQSILAWLERTGHGTRELTELEGDVSVRRYFRVQLDDETSAIVALYPAEIRQACSNFLATNRLLQGVDVPVPEVLAADCDEGLMLMNDLGPGTLYDHRDDPWDALLPYLQQAIDYADRIRSLPLEEVSALNPALDEDLLWHELEQTWRLCLQPWGVLDGKGFAAELWGALHDLCRHLGSESPVPCHRDFMARNLVPVSPHPTLVVLDHQDLRSGPRFYDLASLLNDSLFVPETIEEELTEQRLTGREQRTSYHRAATQRTLKAVGTYEAFSQRGDDRHRSLIPGTLARAIFHFQQTPEAQSVGEELLHRLRPLLPDDDG